MELGKPVEINGVWPKWLDGDTPIAIRRGDGKWYFEDNPVPSVHTSDKVAVTALRLPVDHWAYPVLAAGFVPWAGGDEAPGDWDGGEVLRRGDPSYGAYPKPWIDWYEVNQRWFHVGHDGKFADIIGYKPRAEQVQELAQPGAIDWTKPIEVVYKGTAYPAELTGEDDMGDCHRVRVLDGSSGPWWAHRETGEIKPTDYRVRNATPAEIEQYKAENGLEAAYADTAPVAQEIEAGDVTRFDSVSDLIDDLNDRVTIAKMSLAEATEKELDPFTMGYLGLIRDETPIERFERHHGGLDDNQRDIVEIYQDWLNSQT